MDNCVTYSSFNRSYTDRKLQNKCGISYAVLYILINFNDESIEIEKGMRIA